MAVYHNVNKAVGVFKRIRIFLVSMFLTDSEKYILTQSISLKRIEITDACLCDYKEDLKELDTLALMTKTSLWQYYCKLIK